MWLIRLTSGAEIELWADAHDTEPVDGHWQFNILADATADKQREIRVSNHTVPPSERCVVVVARIPVSEVDTIEGGWPLTEEPNNR